MKIRMINHIQLDDQTEVVDQSYPVEKIQKGKYTYLIFHNDESEKVVLKFDETELVMTRFSNPASIMRFIKDKEVLVSIHTPVGIQQLVTSTHLYHMSEDKIQLAYQLKTADGKQVFASYEMSIFWK